VPRAAKRKYLAFNHDLFMPSSKNVLVLAQRLDKEAVSQHNLLI
jgi:hypothetical protein